MVKELFNVNIVTEGPLQYTANTTLDALNLLQNTKKGNQNGLLWTNLYSNAHSR